MGSQGAPLNSAFALVRHQGRDYRVYLAPGPELRGRVAGLQWQHGRLVERDMNADSQKRHTILAMAKLLSRQQGAEGA